MTDTTNVNTWSPEQSTQASTNKYCIKNDFLLRTINFMLDKNGCDIRSFLTPQEQEQHRAIMQQPKALWITISEGLSNEAIIALIKFFTLAEMQYSQWRADELSPVIGLTRGLKKKGEKIDRELLTWIKKESDNKFLPNGPL
ncbi:hypothetical protein ACVBE9_08605 [Eionea flava]